MEYKYRFGDAFIESALHLLLEVIVKRTITSDNQPAYVVYDEEGNDNIVDEEYLDHYASYYGHIEAC